MNLAEKTVYLNRLFDIYAPLLTKRQQEIFRYYYQEDYSYQEIADILEISRSGVYDTLQRALSSLEEYEEKLAFLQKLDVFIEDLSSLDDQRVDQMIEKFLKGGKYV